MLPLEALADIQINTLTPEHALAGLRTADITQNHELRRQAYSLIVSGYRNLSSDPLLNDAQVEEMLFPGHSDAYVDCGRARILAAITDSPITHQEIVTGVVRVVSGKCDKLVDLPDDLPRIDAMALITLPEWPHRQMGISDYEIGEFGRFAIDEYFRTPTMQEQGVPIRITAMLYQEAQKVAELRGIKYMYAIMPSYVNRLVQRAGIRTQPIEGAEVKKTTDNLKLFLKFDRYWNLNPQLYRFS